MFSQQSPQPSGRESHPQPAITYLITPRHEPDDGNTTPPTTVDHPRVAPGEPTDPVPPDTDPGGSDRDVFLSPGGSHQSGDGSESGDSSHANETPEQESSNEGTPQASPQTRTRPGPKAAKQPRSAFKRIADHNSGPLPVDPGHHVLPPPVTELGTRPRLTSRSGRLLMPPAKLTHTSSFAQHDARVSSGLHPPESAAQESPSPSSSPSDRAHQQTLTPRNQNNRVLNDISHPEHSEPNNSLPTHRITCFADSTGTLYLLTTIIVLIAYLFS